MDAIQAILSNPAAVAAIGTIVSVVLMTFWPAAGAVWIKLLPAIRQIPTIVKALQSVDIPGDLKEEAAITKAMRGAGVVQTAIVKASGGRDAVRRVVRSEARKILSGDGIGQDAKF